MLKQTVTILMFCLLPTHATAAVLDVCAGGCSYAMVADAVAAAADHDTIELLDPLHTEAGMVVEAPSPWISGRVLGSDWTWCLTTPKSP